MFGDPPGGRMHCDPLEVTLDVVPRARFDLIDLRSYLPFEKREALSSFARSLYWSSHTTAGFLEPSTAARLWVRPGVNAYLQVFRSLFPEGADYEHDRLDLRTELQPEQRLVEPRNADSHLAFIAAGLRSCVTASNKSGPGACFVDLDGMNDGRPRTRRTRIIGFNEEVEIGRTLVEIPVSSHAVDSVNLKDPRLGVYDQIREFVRKHDVAKGRLRLSLDQQERHAGLTVNEYETLLMRHDLPEVLRNPLRFALERGRHALAEPRKVPAKTLGYAKYDLVRIVNQIVDTLGLHESLVERLIARSMAAPAARFFRMKRSISLLVSDGGRGPTLVEGTYQSPILVQWDRAVRQSRLVEVTLTAVT